MTDAHAVQLLATLKKIEEHLLALAKATGSIAHLQATAATRPQNR
jgi:hypothetical protein